MTSSNSRDDRLSKLKQVPAISALDHRLFLDDEGRDRRLEALPRNQRRALKRQGVKLGTAYNKVLQDLDASGAGYEPDQFLRQMAREYTHRYASSGLHNQPVSFNYFEAFCVIDFLPKSVAPFVVPAPETDHLFSVADYFDHITAPGAAPFNLASLMDLPEGRTFHYTPNGSLFDFTYSNAEGRDFLVGGCSLIRRGTSLHWSLVGGELHAEAEWDALATELQETETRELNPAKARYLTAMMAIRGAEVGEPLALEGAPRARKTVIAGETDLVARKHLGRYLATEAENAFQLICDDPDLLVGANLTPDETDRRREIIRAQMQHAAVMFDLAEAMFQLPVYFNHKVAVAKTLAITKGKRAPATAPKAAAGTGVKYRYVTALEFVDAEPEKVRTLVAPGYAVETDGHWRRLAPGESGWSAAGDRVNGRTWVKAEHDWRARSEAPRPIYIKSSVAAAKRQRDNLLAQAGAAVAAPAAEEPAGVLYVMRCEDMKDEVYKLGWSSNTAAARAAQLSSATGVPTPFKVVSRWPHAQAEQLEGAVHAMLAPYRIAAGREFFRAPLETVTGAVEAEIRRMARRG